MSLIHDFFCSLPSDYLVHCLGLQISTGDADLPFRDDLGDRRRKHEIQMSNKAVDMQQDDNEEDDNTKPEPEEDEFYKQARLLKEAKKAAKLAKYSMWVFKNLITMFLLLTLPREKAV